MRSILPQVKDIYCSFIECNISDSYWCECVKCGREIEGFAKAEELNKIEIHCNKKATSISVAEISQYDLP